ncbi:hypothetical protein ACQP1G_26355 [Nocardia sp. CA-107356]|uniref:hypothetical protein n=1 Tax=Nocardia sp. CA-107356 TaxID=3239972 RepID=UPI003D89EE6F
MVEHGYLAAQRRPGGQLSTAEWVVTGTPEGTEPKHRETGQKTWRATLAGMRACGYITGRGE